MALDFLRNLQTRFLSFFNDSMIRSSILEQGLDWRFAAGLWRITAVKFMLQPKKMKAQNFMLFFPLNL